ncbi:MAG: hypothetical protein ACRDFW_13180, partial [bacterium]
AQCATDATWRPAPRRRWCVLGINRRVMRQTLTNTSSTLAQAVVECTVGRHSDDSWYLSEVPPELLS